jgi:trans-aconitate methyltransferase
VQQCAPVKERYRHDWDELAQREPYFAVLTDPRFLRKNLDDESRREFFDSGQRDVDHLLATIGETLGRPFFPARALDFGCGVGRLTLPLARRCERVVGCDIAPEMVVEARRNALCLDITNATFVTSVNEDQQFDLICSLIVFQHIPVREGLATLSTLLRLLSPRGVAAIHFTLGRPGTGMRRFARRLLGAIPFVHRLALRLERDPLNLPYMQMNAYDRDAIERRIVESTGARPHVIPRSDGAIEGGLFIVERG